MRDTGVMTAPLVLPRERADAPRLLPLAARGITLDVDGHRLLDGVDLAVPASNLTVIMGPNGAGKSLLLRILHGLIEPTGGTVSWNGEPPTDAVRRRQAMVFQRPVLLRRSAAANIDFVLAHRGGRDAAMRDALLDRVGLLDRADVAARRLSGGEQQRLALARALATEPEILFLDEPTANLDPASTLRIEEIVLGARAAGIGVMLVTHDLGQARRLADEIVFLHHGRVREQTATSQFFDAPRSAEARDFVAGRIVL